MFQPYSIFMNGSKNLQGLSKTLAPILLFLGAAVSPLQVTATDRDHKVLVEKAQPLEQIVDKELDSDRFARQIAEYNGIPGITTIVPAGTVLQIPQPYLRNREFGTVVFAKGDVVHAQQELVVNPPMKGAYVYEGDRFITGEDGFISLHFSSGAIINVQPESRVSVTDIACPDRQQPCVIALNAQQGEVESHVTARPDGAPPIKFSVNTPFLSAAVRGTSFYVNANRGADRLGVTEGVVGADAAGTATELPEGQGLLAEANAQPVQVDLLRAPVLTSETGAIYSTEDKLRWQVLQDAQQYKLVISEDEQMTQRVFTDSISGNTAFLPQDIEAGEYFVSVAGIDGNQFTGMPSIVSFNYATITDQEALEFDIESSEGIVSIAPLSYTGQVEIIITDDLDNPSFERREIRSLTDGAVLQLAPSQDWVIRGRKVFSPTSVSAYSSDYVLRADK